MVTIVLALAVANLGLGFALAVAVDRLGILSTLTSLHRTTTGPPGRAGTSRQDDGPLAMTPLDAWSRMLRSAEVDPKSVFEQLLWIVKLETITRRRHLLELDRSFFDPGSPPAIGDELKQQFAAFHQLLESLIVVADDVKQQSPLGESLQELLLDQAFQLHACLEGLAASDPDDVARQLATAMTAVNLLRDRTDVLLAQLLMSENRLRSVAARHRTFGARDTLTHLGLAAQFDEWWADDPDQVRLVSLVMLDLDRFGTFTQKVGAARGDIALLRFGDMLHDLVRKDRGFDRVARFSGQRFVMFLGDTSAKNAAKGAERIRQAIEATSFQRSEETFEVTASLAVAEVGKMEGPCEFIPRLEAVLSESKKAGRNCGYVDSDDGPKQIVLPQYKVSVRVIELDK